jgi:hypothetical protein
MIVGLRASEGTPPRAVAGTAIDYGFTAAVAATTRPRR